MLQHDKLGHSIADFRKSHVERCPLYCTVHRMNRPARNMIRKACRNFKSLVLNNSSFSPVRRGGIHVCLRKATSAYLQLYSADVLLQPCGTGTMASMKGATGVAGLLQEGGGQITTKVWESFLTKAEQASSAVAETAEQTSNSVAQSAKEMSDKVF